MSRGRLTISYVRGVIITTQRGCHSWITILDSLDSLSSIELVANDDGDCFTGPLNDCLQRLLKKNKTTLNRFSAKEFHTQPWEGFEQDTSIDTVQVFIWNDTALSNKSETKPNPRTFIMQLVVFFDASNSRLFHCIGLVNLSKMVFKNENWPNPIIRSLEALIKDAPNLRDFVLDVRSK